MEPYWDIVQGLPTTLALTGLSVALGLVLGLPLVLARRSRARLLRLSARALIDGLRAVPPLVWLFIIFFGVAQVGPTFSPFIAAFIGLGLVTSAHMAEAYRGGLMAVDKGQFEAAAALGLNSRDVFRRVVGPQAFRVALPAMTSVSIALLKDTSIAYTVGVTEIMYRANNEALSGVASSLSILAFAALLYACITVPTAIFTRRLDSHLRRRVAR